MATTTTTRGMTVSVACDCETCRKHNAWVPDYKTRPDDKRPERCNEYKAARKAADQEEIRLEKVEAERQEEVNKRRTKARTPADAKIGEAITSRRLKDWYGHHYKTVLSGLAIRALSAVDSREPVYEIIASVMPDSSTYATLRNIAFTKTIDDLIGDANGIIQELAEEMRSWHDNMPEGLQNGDKGQEVDQAASDLESIDEIEVPESLTDVKLVHLPPRTGGSRGDRLAEATSMLEAVMEWLEGDDVQQHLLDKGETAESASKSDAVEGEDHDNATYYSRDDVEALEEGIENAMGYAEGVSFPGMY